MAVAAQAALLASATGRPVRLFLSRREDLTATSRRHPARVRIRVGATREGHLIGAEVDVLLDGGAYATLSPLVLFESAVHACGPYRVPNVRVDAKVVRTHSLPSGAFRGSGAVPVAFAFESQMDLLAERLGQDPFELRRKNALGRGGRDDHRPEARRQRRASRGAGEGRGVLRVGRRDARRSRRTAGAVRRGIGVAASYNGVGIGPLGKHLQPAAGASVVVAADGSVTVSVGRHRHGPGGGHGPGADRRGEPPVSRRAGASAPGRHGPRGRRRAFLRKPGDDGGGEGGSGRRRAGARRHRRRGRGERPRLEGRRRALRPEAHRPGGPRVVGASRGGRSISPADRGRRTRPTRSPPAWPRWRSTPPRARRV